MTIERALVGTTDAAAVAANYIEDCFSCYLYTGTGAAQTINNGIDLATKGGMVWAKSRNNSAYHGLSGPNFSTSYSGGYGGLRSNQTTALGPTDFTGVTSTGYTLGYIGGDMNFSGYTYASLTFRKQPKFFDIVTYTGTGSATTIAHSLGCAPGMIIIKRTNTTGNWQVYHNGLTSAANSIQLNLTAAQASDTTVWNSTAPTSSVFSVGTHADVNASGGTYVAYLYAASNSGGFGSAGTDSVVACGSFSASSATNVTLGWEPQYILLKQSSGAQSWYVVDVMRGMSYTSFMFLQPNATAAETDAGVVIKPTATGFTFDGTNLGSTSGQSYIYLAIRRPMKTPTDATKVFSPITSSAATGTTLTTGFPVDTQISSARAYGSGSQFVDRLRSVSTNATGNGVVLYPFSTSAEQSDTTSSLYWDNTGFQIPSVWGGSSVIYWNFRRAPGFFDVVCYTGTGSATTVAHNLGVVPELIIVKSRSNASTNWAIYSGPSGAIKFQQLENTIAATNGTSYWNSTLPTSSVFTVNTNGNVNTSAATYVAYLFATCPGVSKVFSFTGNGSSQTIDCGFTSGARFVLIKRTDAAGDWYVWDTARGIVAGNDPHLSLNSTAAEVTSNDTIDPASSGFIVNQVAATNVNVSSATYIGLAIA